uniref:WD repeat domain 31 n=1 Tax=Junco hyemalis TaxID=40217 RepID=A0A8C5JQ67_JUNHY
MGKLQSKISFHTTKYRAEGSVGQTGPAGASWQHSPAHSDAVTSVAALKPDLCVSGGRDKSVAVSSWRSGAALRRFTGHEREVTKVTSALDSSRVFSASRDKTVMMWELQGTAGPRQHFPGHDLVVTGLAVSPDASQLCTGSRDNTVCKWDTETGECLGRAAISRNLVGSAGSSNPIPSSISLPTLLFHMWGCAERIFWELGAKGNPWDTVQAQLEAGYSSPGNNKPRSTKVPRDSWQFINALAQTCLEAHRVMESLRLEKTSKTESSHSLSSATATTNSCPQVPHLHGF